MTKSHGRKFDFDLYQWIWPYINIDLIIGKIQPMLNLKLPTDNTFYKTVWIWKINSRGKKAWIVVAKCMIEFFDVFVW